MAPHLEDNLEDILQKARTGKGFSLPGLSSQTGLDEKKLKKFEDGIETPTSEQLRMLAQTLGLEKNRLEEIGNKRWTPLPFPKEAEKEVITLKGYLGDYEVKGYLFVTSHRNEALLIDTAYNPDLVLKTLWENDLSLKAILLTHAHHDHIHGISKIRTKTGAQVYLHARELPLYKAHETKPPDQMAEEGITIGCGQKTLKVLETPGHTPGGVSYYSGKYCFVGDALFAGSTGRSFSPDGFQTLLSSLKEKVLTLPEETILCPGHGPTTTVGEERRHNPFF
ncbi:MAG TPA: MBL fold metallo-hydrolase [Nitrospiria bacterium]|jgi:glyoxylase-like metal-dependent hydrolase (beta-lactamase superfamily II)